MKNYLFILCMISFLAQSCCEKPILIGHRGSLLGVENTEEAFINGATYFGYQGLECDVKTTKDGQCVCWHDNDLKRVGIDSVLIAETTLDSLQTITLTQTRKDITYTATICTVDRYLEICKQHNVFPVVELKWATGINNNDMSLFPSLYALIEKHSLVEEAVILTSMRKSLEYIRTNYPQLQCQYLRQTVKDEDVQWCHEWKANISIQHANITPELVNTCNELGVEVAAWTVNNDSTYQRLVDCGCAFVTTDYLEVK
jgi:glycerophosphoryl diester phosphodiesterase